MTLALIFAAHAALANCGHHHISGGGGSSSGGGSSTPSASSDSSDPDSDCIRWEKLELVVDGGDAGDGGEAEDGGAVDAGAEAIVVEVLADAGPIGRPPAGYICAEHASYTSATGCGCSIGTMALSGFSLLALSRLLKRQKRSAK